jgi:hypothetical protein
MNAGPLAGIETHGKAILNILSGLGPLSGRARALFAEEGVRVDGPSDRPVLGEWFPLDANLRVLRRIGGEFGADVLRAIGASVPLHAVFPPSIHDVESALAAIDVAYHLNHRRGGVVMFDPARGHMLEGIGHYGYRADGAGRLVCECTSVYPCAFDHGLVSGMATRFAAGAEVLHGQDEGCRESGAGRCVYRVRC